MPVSRTNRHRRAKALKYGAKDARYQYLLREYEYSRGRGYQYPEQPPTGGNQTRAWRPMRRRF